MFAVTVFLYKPVKMLRNGVLPLDGSGEKGLVPTAEKLRVARNTGARFDDPNSSELKAVIAR